MIVEMPRIVILPDVKEDDDSPLTCGASDYSTDWTVCSKPASICVVYHDTIVYYKRMMAFFCEEHRPDARRFVKDLLTDITRQVKAECNEVYDSTYYRALGDDKLWAKQGGS